MPKNVQVAVRCRPVLNSETEMPQGKIECNEIDQSIRIQSSKTMDKVFTFDRILPETTTQEDMFEYVSPMVDHALDGLHATIFAYGQTGSGKTYTMEGIQYTTTEAEGGKGRLRPNLNTPKESHGIILRVIECLFHRMHERMSHNATIRYKVKCSFLQLYNERVMDLLNPSSMQMKEGLRIRYTRDDHFNVENLFIFDCDTAEQVRELFFLGTKHKIMGTHQMNIQSSRSHCLFTLYVHSWDSGSPECVINSELTLVDLAGSEKLALLASDPSPQLLKESIEINTSLLALGKVITALAVGTRGHVPYRDSKLTRLLKHALGGNSMTVMIACIAPLDAYVEETLSTLLYAGRARNITNDPRVNEDPRSALIRQLREEIVSLKKELAYYRRLALNQCEGDDESRDAPIPRPASGPVGMGEPLKERAPCGDSALAEKFVESCRMLKNVISLNGQLREAFDRLNELKKQSENRELELNAENLQLRERIEMLESITLTSTQNTNERVALHSSSSSLQAASSGGKPTQRTSEVKVYDERLSMYNDKYRNPTKKANYEEYYAIAKPASTRHSSVVSQIESLLKKVPVGTQNMIPLSLQSTAAFGSLAFGGTEADRHDMEERRRDRQRRQQELEEKHRMMQAGIGACNSSQSFDRTHEMLSAPHNFATSGVPPLSRSVQPPPDTYTGKLFAYLSQEESQSHFTPQQLELLRVRASGCDMPVSGGISTEPPTNLRRLPVSQSQGNSVASSMRQGTSLTLSHRQ